MITKPRPLRMNAIGSSVGSARGREPPHREVRDEVEAEHRPEEQPEVGRDVGLVGQEQQHVAAAGDEDRHEAEAELVAAPAPRRPGDRVATIRSCCARAGGRRRRWRRRSTRTSGSLADARPVRGAEVVGSERGGPFDRRIPHEHATRHALEHRDPPVVEGDEVVLAGVPAHCRDRDAEHEQDRDHPERDAPPAPAVARLGDRRRRCLRLGQRRVGGRGHEHGSRARRPRAAPRR